MRAWACECGDILAVRDPEWNFYVEVVKPCVHGRPPPRGKLLYRLKPPRETP